MIKFLLFFVALITLIVYYIDKDKGDEKLWKEILNFF